MAVILSNGTGGGNWSATGSWSGGVVPVLGDQIFILTGDTITVDDTSRAGGDDSSTGINIAGILKFSRTANSTLRVRGEINISAGGEYDMGKSADAIPVTYKANLQLNDSAALVDGKWGLTCEYTADYFVYGASKTTNAHLTTQLLASGTSFDLNDVTGWEIGDELAFATTSAGFTSSESEVRTISNIVGNTITISSGVTYQHEINGRVGNLTKNCLISAYNTAYASYQNLKHNSTTTPASREIQNLSLKDIGDNSSQVKYGAIRFDGTASTINPYIAVKGISIYGTESTGIDFYNSAERITVEDVAFYSTGGAGINCRQGAVATFNNFILYRSATGVFTAWSHGGVNCVFNDCWFIGCGIVLNYSSGQGFIFNDCTFASSTTVFQSGYGVGATFNNCAVGYSSGSYNGSCVNGFNLSSNSLTNPSFNDCTYNVTNDYGNLIVANSAFKLNISNKDVDPSQQEVYTPTGILYRDNTTYKTGVASLRAEPLDATNPISNTWQIFAPTGELVVVSGYLRKNSSYGSSNLPKVTLSGLGITESIFTMNDVDDTWVQFTVSATQTTGTDGVLTLTADFQSGTAGAKAWIDGIVAPSTVAVNSGDFGYWAEGQPAKLVASNFTSADDVWNKLTTDITLVGSIGKQLKDNVNQKLSEKGVLEINK